jgi:hypothetical protein
MLRTLLLATLLAVPALADDHPPRIQTPNDFPEVKITSTFAYDRGYAVWALSVNGKKCTDRGEATNRIMALRHWTKLSRTDREHLADLWTRQVLLSGQDLIEEPSPAFLAAKQAFQPFTVSSTSAGQVTVSAWVEGPSGMRPGHDYYHERHVFSSDGHYRALKDETFSDRQL